MRPVQGVLLHAMKIYVVAELGPQVWEQLLRKVGRPSTYEYAFDRNYPDGELELMTGHAAEIVGKPVTDVLEEFGEALLPLMFDYYGHLVDPGWGYFDFLVNMEPLLHSALSLHTVGAQPTRIKAVRAGPESVRIVYVSPLRLCAAVRGVIKGAARRYDVEVVVVDEQCVLRGDSECVITVSHLN